MVILYYLYDSHHVNIQMIILIIYHYRNMYNFLKMNMLNISTIYTKFIFDNVVITKFNINFIKNS